MKIGLTLRRFGTLAQMNVYKSLLSSFAILTLFAGVTRVDAQGTSTDTPPTCFPSADLAKYQLQSGTRIAVRTRLMLVQRTDRTAKAHIFVGANAINGTVGDGTITFEKSHVVLDPGVPVNFTIDHELCPIPVSSEIPNFLKNLPLFTVP